MTPRQWLGLAVRLFAVWLAISAVQTLALAETYKSAQRNDATWMPYGIAALYWLAAVLLWLFPLSVAGKLLPRDAQDAPPRLPARQAVEVACVILGLAVILLRALPELSAYASYAALWIASGATINSMGEERQVIGLVGLVDLVVGLVFVTRAGPLARKIVLRAD